MSKFKFKLDPALRWRSALVSREEARLEELRTERQRIEDQKQRLLAERRAAEALLTQERTVSGSTLSGFAAYRLSSQNTGHHLEECASAVSQKIEAQNAALRQARRDFQLLERLRDQQAEVWRLETDRQFETEAGDSFLASWSRRK